MSRWGLHRVLTTIGFGSVSATSLATAVDVDAWYERLKARGVALDGPPTDGAEVPVGAFTFRDPERHTLEVFTWLAR